MKFPVLIRKPYLPTTPRCPQCKKKTKPGTMAVLMGGAMRVTDAKNKCADVAADCIGFLYLFWHAHDGSDTYLPIAEDTPRGQFELYFCSTDCLRAFLCACVDELERRRERHRTTQTKRRSATPHAKASRPRS